MLLHLGLYYIQAFNICDPFEGHRFFVKIFDPSTNYILVHVMPLVYRGLRTLHYVDLPSAARRLKANFLGRNCF